ncbi:MAG: tetratricopeptide (TPR) repeat protein [Candidatus Azotimanducaceae bacterium]|jgi:tetratricopeptide (TPR) repeat protein
MEIPGLALREVLARTEHLDVYRCVRASDNKSLVVKILNEDYVGNDRVISQLILGCEHHSRVQHPNVVPIFHFTRKDDSFYIVEGYIAGPCLLDELATGISFPKLVERIIGVTKGLAAVHAAGIVHGDLKPEHIRVRSNGIPQILDFSHAVKVGQQGDGWGTPGYLSPEQSLGLAVDGRSDLYSLGLVVFRALAGYVPPLSPNSATQTQRAPRLPDHFSLLQPFIDKALAVDVKSRFETAQEFGAALLQHAEQAQEHRVLPMIRSKPIATQEIRSLGGGALITAVDSTRQERRSERLVKRVILRRVSFALVLLGTLVGGGLYVERNNLISVDQVLTAIGIVEDPALIAAWNDAQALQGDSNQDLAAIAAGFRRVLVLDGKHQGATDALHNLESIWKAQAAEGLSQGNLEAVGTRLEEAESVFPDDVDWLDLRNQLQDRRRAQRILTSTRQLLTSHGLSDLPSATAAIQSYQEVLRLWPGHDEAKTALTELSVHYAQLANLAVKEGRLNDGISLLERATAADNAVPMLDEVRKLISQVTTAQAAIDDLLQQARRLRSQNQLMLPSGENAAELYHRVLATDPDNAIAAQGLIEITSQVAATAEALLSANQLSEVDVLVSQAQAAGLVQEGVAEIRRRLDAEHERQNTIFDNLLMAQQLMAQGYLTLPVGQNAVAKLREVQQVDPGNADAIELLKQCAQKLANVAVEAHEQEFTDEAKEYLDLALAITPDVESWIALREGWGEIE